MKYNIFLLISAFALLISAITSAQAATLKTQSVISDDVIRLGDLFDGLDYNLDRVIGNAPRPGQDLVLDANTLLRVAVAMDVQWRPTGTTNSLVIRRSATVVPLDVVKGKIEEALADKHLGELYNIRFNSGASDIVLPPRFNATVELTDINYNNDTDWFEAKLSAPSKANPHTQINVSGKIERLTQIPVLRDTIRNGMIIGARDVDMITVPSSNLNHDTFLYAEDLYGLTPRRMITAGKAVKAQDVEEPQIVKRGGTVTMRFASGPLQLTAIGKAMEDGSKGDTIRVVNNQSSRTIDALVTGENEVTVKIF